MWRQATDLAEHLKAAREELAGLELAHRAELARVRRAAEGAERGQRLAERERARQAGELEERLRFWEEEAEKARRRAEEKDAKVVELVRAPPQ